MDAQQTFVYYINKALTPQKAKRFTALAGTRKGQQKILDGLCHQFKEAVRDGATRRSNEFKPMSNPTAPMLSASQMTVLRSHARVARFSEITRPVERVKGLCLMHLSPSAKYAL
jgi:hypothetical protein